MHHHASPCVINAELFLISMIVCIIWMIYNVSCLSEIVLNWSTLNPNAHFNSLSAIFLSSLFLPPPPNIFNAPLIMVSSYLADTARNSNPRQIVWRLAYVKSIANPFNGNDSEPAIIAQFNDVTLRYHDVFVCTHSRERVPMTSLLFTMGNSTRSYSYRLVTRGPVLISKT